MAAKRQRRVSARPSLLTVPSGVLSSVLGPMLPYPERYGTMRGVHQSLTATFPSYPNPDPLVLVRQEGHNYGRLIRNNLGIFNLSRLPALLRSIEEVRLHNLTIMGRHLDTDNQLKIYYFVPNEPRLIPLVDYNEKFDLPDVRVYMEQLWGVAHNFLDRIQFRKIARVADVLSSDQVMAILRLKINEIEQENFAVQRRREEADRAYALLPPPVVGIISDYLPYKRQIL